MSPSRPKKLKLVQSCEIPPRLEQELIEYINFSEMLRSPLGAQAERSMLGLEREFCRDPETSIIRVLDKVGRYRRVHQLMASIGRHQRTLIRVYLVDRKPPYVENRFGKLSGIVLGLVDNVTVLSDRCRRSALKKASEEDKRALQRLHLKSTEMYVAACSAYLSALRSTQRQRDDGQTAHQVQFATPPHECRVSMIYPCPCRGNL